jgi:hypothetical protein
VGDVDLIVAAFTAGATAGVSDAASSAVKDSYAALRKVVHDKVAGRGSKNARVLEESEPLASERLRDQLIRAGADRDKQIIDAAKSLLALLSQSDAGPKYSVKVTDSTGVIVGDHNIYTQYLT